MACLLNVLVHSFRNRKYGCCSKDGTGVRKRRRPLPWGAITSEHGSILTTWSLCTPHRWGTLPNFMMETHSKPPTASLRRERSHSFSLFNSILGRRRSARSDALEPVEVAPGIMSTDATAIVFELDPRRTKSWSPRKQNNKEGGGDGKEKTLPMWRAIRAAHDDDGTDDFSKHPARVATTSYFEKRDRRRDEARVNRLKAEEQSARGRRRGRMRDSADYLTVRFVNPATGLVSPSLVSDTTTPSPPETSRDAGDEKRPNQLAERKRNERNIEELKRLQGDVIRAKSSQWNVAQTPMLSPIPQSSGTTSPAGRGAPNPTVALGDRFVLHMPSAQEPCPFEHPGKTSEQILAYQQGVEAARRRASGGLVDPSTPPSPRSTSPNERLNALPYPDTKPAMIRRKPVGSPASRRSESEDTVIINGSRRAASVPASNRTQNQPVIKVTSPERVTRNLSSTSGRTASQHHSQSQQPFLGGRADGRPFGPLCPLAPNQEVETHHLGRRDTEQPNPHRPPYHLSRLPEVNITPPNSASIPTSQRSRGIKGQSLQGAFTTTTPTTIPTTTTTTTGSTLRREFPQKESDMPLLLSSSLREYPIGRSMTPEQRGPQLHHKGSLSAPQAQNGIGPVQQSSFLHPPCLVPGQRAQGPPPSTRTSTSTSLQTSPQAQQQAAEGLERPTSQIKRFLRIGSLGSSARDSLSAGVSVRSGGHRGMDMDGVHEALDSAGDPQGLLGAIRKVSNVDCRTVSMETRSSKSSNGVASSVPSDDQLTEWRAIGRWRPPLTPDEEKAKERLMEDVSVLSGKPSQSEAKDQKPKDPFPTNQPTTTTLPNSPSWRTWSRTFLLPPNSCAHKLFTTFLTMLRHIQTRRK
ncbi:MAG: hypothetical protein M1840_002804 [Geoglossum simile]|nr:MAG: hypothetical protein M1840_002804 [Geoglossum simile]